MADRRVHIVLLAGGSGSRMGADVPKQFLLLKGRPILAHSLDVFLAWSRTATVCLVSRPDLLDRTRETVAAAGPASAAEAKILYTGGGATRHASTLAGVQQLRSALEPEDLIFIHDAARPLIEAAELDRLAAAFDDSSVAIASLVSRITDTVVAAPELPGTMTEKLDRDRLFAVKTPQALGAAVLEQMIAIPERPEFTDLLTWGAAAGFQGRLVEAGPLNHKVTTERDLRFLEGV